MSTGSPPTLRAVFVTGATGFLGGAVARDLTGRGVRVVGAGRNREKGAALEAAGVAFHPCDLAHDPDGLARAVAGSDAVVHCAALSAPWGPRRKFVAANVTATRHVVAACERGAVPRLVHVSTPSVLSAPREQIQLTESTAWATPPANQYVATKRRAESHVLDAARKGLDAIVLRPKALFGPGDTTLLPRVLRVAARGRFPLLGDRDPSMDLTWIGDAVTAVRLALEAPSTHRGKVYHVTSGDPQPRSRILETIFEACGLGVRFRRIPLDRALALAGLLEGISRAFTLGRWEPPFTRFTVAEMGFGVTLNIDAARADLGYRPAAGVIERLRETGAAWRTAHTAQGARP